MLYPRFEFLGKASRSLPAAVLHIPRTLPLIVHVFVMLARCT